MDKKLNKIVLEILRQLYLEATPPLNLDEAMESQLTKKDDWYQNHFLSQTRQNEIIEEHLKNKKLTGLSKSAVTFNVHNYAPRG